jgi:Flp pilus assembly protein TadB
MMKLMRVTPDWKSGYYWLAILAYFVFWSVVVLVFDPITFMQRFVLWLPCTLMFFWLVKLARHAQLEADWELPKTPRIDINE